MHKVILHPIIVAGMLLVDIVYAVMAVFNVMGPFIIQTSLNYTAIQYGHIALFLGLAWFCGGLVNRYLSSRFNAHRILSGGLIITTIVILVSAIVSVFLPFTILVVIAPLLVIYLLGGLLLPA